MQGAESVPQPELLLVQRARLLLRAGCREWVARVMERVAAPELGEDLVRVPTLEWDPTEHPVRAECPAWLRAQEGQMLGIRRDTNRRPLRSLPVRLASLVLSGRMALSHMLAAMAASLLWLRLVATLQAPAQTAQRLRGLRMGVSL